MLYFDTKYRVPNVDSPKIYLIFNNISIGTFTQFEDFRIFLSLRFYVKSILANLEILKNFFAFSGILNLVNFSLQKSATNHENKYLER